jgi:hypothetical protein
MIEPLAQFLLRLSEADEPIILWGRAARPYLGAAFDDLLSEGVLSEEAPAREWPVCATCECSLDVRPVRVIGKRHIACCPLDQTSDEVLEEIDLRTFRVESKQLVHRISSSSRLREHPSELTPGVWDLGRLADKHVVIALCVRAAMEADRSLLHSLAEEANLILLAPLLSADQRLQLASTVKFEMVELRRILGVESASWAIDTTKLSAAGAKLSRLIVDVGRKIAIVDGRERPINSTPFALLHLLAQNLQLGKPLTGLAEIHELLWRRQARDRSAVANVAHKLRGQIGKTEWIISRTSQGYMLDLEPTQVEIRSNPSKRAPS